MGRFLEDYSFGENHSPKTHYSFGLAPIHGKRNPICQIYVMSWELTSL
jgi:hypothetical protein